MALNQQEIFDYLMQSSELETTLRLPFGGGYSASYGAGEIEESFIGGGGIYIMKLSVSGKGSSPSEMTTALEIAADRIARTVGYNGGDWGIDDVEITKPAYISSCESNGVYVCSCALSVRVHFE